MDRAGSFPSIHANAIFRFSYSCVTVCKECTKHGSILFQLGEIFLFALEGCVPLDTPPETCDGYFDPISCEYECLGLLANQSQER